MTQILNTSYTLNHMYQKYTGANRDSMSKGWMFNVNLAWMFALFITGNAVWLIYQSESERTVFCDGKTTQKRNEMYMPYRAALHNAYIPTNKYIVDEDTYKTKKLKINPEPEFHINGFWLTNLLVSLFIISSSIYTYTSYKKDFDTVDMMHALETYGKQYNLNTDQVKKLVKSSYKIISCMSSDKRVYFDMLQSNKIDIKDKKTFVDMAVAILEGYLRSHPDETQKILQIFAQNKQIITKLKNTKTK